MTENNFLLWWNEVNSGPLTDFSNHVTVDYIQRCIVSQIFKNMFLVGLIIVFSLTPGWKLIFISVTVSKFDTSIMVTPF